MLSNYVGIIRIGHPGKAVDRTRYPVGIYLFNVSNGNTRTMCETCLKLSLKTPEQCHLRRSCVFIVNFGQISHMRFLLTFNQ